MNPKLNFIFSVGYRCNSVDFLKRYNLRQYSGPFDYLFIDLETSFQIINNKFDNFLNDIIVFHKNQKKLELVYNKNTSECENKFYELIKNDIGYMAHNYNNNLLFINQNYIEKNKLSHNLYDWNRECIFLHHNLLDTNIYNKLKIR